MDKPWPRQSLSLLLSLGLALSPLSAVAGPIAGSSIKTGPISGASLTGIGLGSKLTPPRLSALTPLVPILSPTTLIAPGPILTPAPRVLPAEAVQKVSAALSPENADKLSSEGSSTLAGSLFEGAPAMPGSALDIPGSDSSGISGLTPSADQVSGPQKLAVAERLFAERRPGFGSLKERYHFTKIYLRTFWWYTHDHIMGLWPDFQKKRQAVVSRGQELSVPSSERSFFAHMRVMGQAGPYYVLGFAPRHNDDVVAEATATFDRYFTGAGVGPAQRDAFRRFMSRVRRYNAAGRAPSYVRKHIRDALLSASLKPGDEIAPFFDGLMKQDNTQATADFQDGQAAAILGQFRALVRQALSEEDASASDRILGAVLLGSFASGSPNPKSDFDLQLLTADGSKGRMAAFTDKVTQRWTALGRQAVNPVSVHESPYLPSKSLLLRVHDGPYLVIAADAETEKSLQRAQGERSFWKFQRDLTLKGRFDRALQFSIVYGSTLASDLKTRSPNDRYHYRRLFMQNLWWYTVTHVQNMWPSYKAKRRAAQDAGLFPAVEQPRRFYAAMRIMGQSGPFYVLGFAPLRDQDVLADALAGYTRFFTGQGAGPEGRQAFLRFAQRALLHNAAKRAQTNFRKQLRDALLNGSLKPGTELPAYFDSLLEEDASQKTAQFQDGEAQMLLADFNKAVLATVAEEDPSSDERVMGAVLLGSFASGSAKAGSDFDIQPITMNGRDGKVADFQKRLLLRWKDGGRHAKNPVSIQDFPYPPSKRLIVRIHDGPYLIIAPEQALVQALERAPGEQPTFEMERDLTLRGRWDRLMQYAVVYAGTLYADLKALF